MIKGFNCVIFYNFILKPPKLMLNVKILVGKNLEPKDSNGFSDPFCTLYLSPDTKHKYTTSVKLKTLNPVWDEFCSL